MANKAWSLLFGVVMLGCAISFAISPWMNWWRPEGVSTHAGDVDFLFDVIGIITTFFFFLTEGLLVIFMWNYASSGPGTKPPVSAKAEYPGFIKPLTGVLHDQHRVEMAWTLVPAVILLYIAFAQVGTWARAKYESQNKPKQGEAVLQQIAVSARQFEWRMRYPSAKRFKKWMDDKNPNDADYLSFGKVPQADDIYIVNELHIFKPTEDELKSKPAKGSGVVVHLSTRDVIHSFNLPNLRVKQDALPGKLIPVYFKPTRSNTAWSKSQNRYIDGVKDGNLTDDANHKADTDFIWDIACAELCGWGHYRMIGRVFVHKDQADFENWLKLTEAENHRRK